mmetsp:Transcript_10467/g.19887  ORF Transcript_10467/g.19887 Transcript_10467/m.19887 type:complete len:286 (-) Transcript_10467:111-968(-)
MAMFSFTGDVAVTTPFARKIQSRRLVKTYFLRRGKRVVSRGNAGFANCATSPLLTVKDVRYQPADSGKMVLQGVSLEMPDRGLGIIVGSSGSGKTTLLQCVAGLLPPSEGKIALSTSTDNDEETSMDKLCEAVGMVFQFPERHFLANSVLEELTFGWPRSADRYDMRKDMFFRLQSALQSVGMDNISVDTPVDALSGGYQRRLALALQLVRMPALLLMDEPLAGLDWKTRAELVPLLASVKKERAVLVVSHDLSELAPIADYAWRMMPGGTLVEIPVDQLSYSML